MIPRPRKATFSISDLLLICGLSACGSHHHLAHHARRFGGIAAADHFGDALGAHAFQHAAHRVQPADALGDGGLGVLTVRILVHGKVAVVADVVQPVEQLQVLYCVHRADHHVVIPQTVVVVEVHVEQLAAGPVNDDDGFGDVLIGGQCVAHVDRYPHVRQPYLLRYQQGAGGCAEVTVGARLFRLIFQRQSYVGPVRGALTQAVDQPAVFLLVVCLERVVITVLTIPDVDQVTAQVGSDVEHGPGVRDGPGAHLRVLGREGAAAVDGGSKMIRDDGDQFQVVVLQLATHFLHVARGDVPGPHHLDAS